MAEGNFKDFIPAGGDNSAYGAQGFTDFKPVSPAAPVAPVVEVSVAPSDTPVIAVPTRKELEAKAAELGIDTSGMKTKTEIEEAIAAAQNPAPVQEEAPAPEVVEPVADPSVIPAVPVVPAVEETLAPETPVVSTPAEVPAPEQVPSVEESPVVAGEVPGEEVGPVPAPVKGSPTPVETPPEEVVE